MDKPALDARIAQARTRLANNLGQLQQRMSRARETFSPSTYLSSPWLKVGAGVAIGLLVGRRRRPRLTAAAGVAPASSGLVRAAIMAGMTQLARVMIERVVTGLAAPPAEAEAEAEAETETET